MHSDKTFIPLMSIRYPDTKSWQMKIYIISVEVLFRNIGNILNQEYSSCLVNFDLKHCTINAVNKFSSKKMAHPQVTWTCESPGVASRLLEWVMMSGTFLASFGNFCLLLSAPILLFFVFICWL